jgi:hypothetical protein
MLLVVAKDLWDRHRRLRTHWAALGAELVYCSRSAQTYLNDNVRSPLYRLPTMAYRNALPGLLEAGALTGNEVLVLLEFFNEVETLNRGLEQAHEARRKPSLADE